MLIERQFAGPLRDTLIQRLRDPVDGTICYLYLPITAPHSAVKNNGFVEYGSNTVGSISCEPAPARVAEQAPARAAASPRPRAFAKPANAPQPLEPPAPADSAPRR